MEELTASSRETGPNGSEAALGRAADPIYSSLRSHPMGAVDTHKNGVATGPAGLLFGSLTTIRNVIPWSSAGR